MCWRRWMIVYFLIRLRHLDFFEKTSEILRLSCLAKNSLGALKSEKFSEYSERLLSFFILWVKSFRQTSCGQSAERPLGHILWYRLLSRWHESWSAPTACHLVRGCIVPHAPHGSSSRVLPNRTPQRGKFRGISWSGWVSPWPALNLPIL